MINLKLNSTILDKVCQPSQFRRPSENLRLVHHLLELMRREHGIGLAANQAGIDQRLFVMLIDNELYSCFNPEIISSSDNHSDLIEGCLSFPGERLSISRPSEIQVRYFNAHGRMTETNMTGLIARCFQHELDHLNGITMYERIGAIDGQKLFMGP
jgi:peptide deformylase